MNFKQQASCIMTLLLLGISLVADKTVSTYAQRADTAKPFAANFMTAEELKSKIDKKEPVTIIDVRSNTSYIGSDNKIKGAIHVNPRRLQYRLGFPPLKDLPRDREVVTYCACPSDESSVRAAQTLTEAGFKRVWVLKGGWQAWLQVRGAVETRPKNT